MRRHGSPAPVAGFAPVPGFQQARRAFFQEEADQARQESFRTLPLDPGEDFGV
jgi:hypothetical protein